jgi:hypothetical protein
MDRYTQHLRSALAVNCFRVPWTLEVPMIPTPTGFHDAETIS